MIFVLAIPLQPPMNCLAEVERNLSPPPPKRTENEVDCRQAYQHVVAEEKPVKEMACPQTVKKRAEMILRT